eukprot:Hpha_TRINITY_DN10518_c0_g1::TRINITY_DN10518_c0_g1_i1::g.31539::m.31539
MNPVVEGDREEFHSPLRFYCTAAAACSGVATGMRLPWLLCRHGGGSFLAAYLVALLVVGWPLTLMELALGQLLQRGASGAFGVFGAGGTGTVWANETRGFALGKGAGVGCLWLAAVMCWCYSPVLGYFGVYVGDVLVNGLGSATSGRGNGLNMTAILGQFDDVALDAEREGEGLPVRFFVSLLCAWFVIFTCGLQTVQHSGSLAVAALPLWTSGLLVFVIGALSLGEGGGGMAQIVPRGAEFTFVLICDAVGHALLSCNVGTAALVAFGSFNPPARDVVKYSGLLVLWLGLCAIVVACGVFSTLTSAAGQDQDAESIFRVGVAGGSYEYGYRTTLEVVTMAAGSLQGDGAQRFVGFFIFLAFWIGGLFTLHALSVSHFAALCDFFPGVAARRRWLLALAACCLVFMGAVPFGLSGGYALLTITDRMLSRIALPLAALTQLWLVSWCSEPKTLQQKVIERQGRGCARAQDWFTQGIQYSLGLLRDRINANSGQQATVGTVRTSSKKHVPFVWLIVLKVLAPAALILSIVIAIVDEFNTVQKFEIKYAVACTAPVFYLALLALGGCFSKTTSPPRATAGGAGSTWSTGTLARFGHDELHRPQVANEELSEVHVNVSQCSPDAAAGAPAAGSVPPPPRPAVLVPADSGSV